MQIAPPMRIGQVNKFWGRDRGGVEAVLHDSTVGLARNGHRIEVLACRPWRSPTRGFPPGVVGHELPAPVISSMPVHPAFPTALRRVARSSDVLHFHTPFPLAEASALLLPKNSPWVATVHAEIVGHTRPLKVAASAITRRFLDRMDAIIVSSPPRLDAPALRRCRDRLHMIPFGFDLAAFLGLERGPHSGPLVVLYVGRLVPYKGVDLLLRAATHFDARIDIVGDGLERPRLERLAHSLDLAGRVRFFGHVTDAELPARFRAADVFVLPSRTASETFGIVQVEAMASGLPVVNTSLATGTDWVSQSGLTGLTVPPENPEALATALRNLLEFPEFRAACGERSRRRALTEFGIESHRHSLEDLYSELLKKKRRGLLCQAPQPPLGASAIR